MISTAYIIMALAGVPSGTAAKPKKCKEFKCYGKKDMVPRSPYFNPREDGTCPDGVSPALAPCCFARDACAGLCGATEELCTADFASCAAAACDAVDDLDDADQCHADAKMGGEAPWREGCPGHAAEQKKSCQCVPRGAEAAKRRTQILEHVYRRYNGTDVDGAKLEALVDKADKPAKYAALLLKLAAKYPALLRDAQPPKPKKEKAKPPPKPAKKEKRDEAPTPDASAEATAETVEADDGSDDDAAAEDEDEEVIDLDAEL